MASTRTGRDAPIPAPESGDLSPRELTRLTYWKWLYAAQAVDGTYAQELAFFKWLVYTGRVSDGV